MVPCGPSFSGWNRVGLRHNNITGIVGFAEKQFLNELGDSAHIDSGASLHSEVLGESFFIFYLLFLFLRCSWVKSAFGDI